MIDTTPEHVYDLVSDMPRMGEWSPECQRVEWADDATGPRKAPPSSGTTSGGPAGLMKWSRRGRVLVADRGREFAFVTEEGGRESTEWRYRFEPVDGGTLVTESYDVKWIPAWAADPGRPHQPVPRAARGDAPHTRAAEERGGGQGRGGPAMSLDT